MTMKHFSPVSQKWVPCHATKRPCRYGAENHRTSEQLKQMKNSAPAAKNDSKKVVKSSPGLVINNPADIKTVFGQTVKPASQPAFNEAYNEWDKDNQAYSKVVSELKASQEPVVSDFEGQISELGGEGKSLLGKLNLGQTPALEGLRQYAADQPNEVKVHVASLSLKVEDSEKNFKDVAQRGISA